MTYWLLLLLLSGYLLIAWLDLRDHDIADDWDAIEGARVWREAETAAQAHRKSPVPPPTTKPSGSTKTERKYLR